LRHRGRYQPAPGIHRDTINMVRPMRILSLLLCSGMSFADEGMWTFDNPPVKQLQQKYNFTPTAAWLENVRLASVRFNDGGSGSFVSPTGLVLTNHHVASGQLQKMSSASKDYLKDGFYAASQKDEMKTPDLEINVLISFDDVTARVRAVEKPGMSDQDLVKARKQEMAAIEITAVSIGFTATRSTPISGWCSRPRGWPHSSAAIRTTSRIPDMIWISPCFGSTTTANP
jgi:hypothetical protein